MQSETDAHHTPNVMPRATVPPNIATVDGLRGYLRLPVREGAHFRHMASLINDSDWRDSIASIASKKKERKKAQQASTADDQAEPQPVYDPQADIGHAVAATGAKSLAPALDKTTPEYRRLSQRFNTLFMWPAVLSITGK